MLTRVNGTRPSALLIVYTPSVWTHQASIELKIISKHNYSYLKINDFVAHKKKEAYFIAQVHYGEF